MSALPPVVATFYANTKSYAGGVKEGIAANEKFDKSTTSTQSKMSGGFNKAAAVGKVAFLGLAGAAIGGAAASINAAKDYQELTTQLVTGAGESEDNIKLVSNGLIKMAPAVGMGPAALAKAMFTVESAGYHGAAGLKVMQAAAEGAKIGGADATVVANGLTTAMSDYHIPAAQAASVTSKLIATVASGKTTMGDLSGSLSAVLPAASAAGVGLNQVLGAMATMTGEGISAQQASQDLAGTIRSLQNPTQEQTKAMEALGLNSLTVGKNLGKNGLTGTLGTLVDAITKHMGPAGTVIESTFKKSEAAAADANTELKAMPASMQGIAKQYQAGTITSTQWRAAVKGMTVSQKEMAQQFAATVSGGKGFNDLLKSGGPSAETFSAALSKVTGGSTGMNTALALTGGNMATFNANVKTVGSATTEAGGHVKGWAETSKDLNVQIAKGKAAVEALSIKIGTALIPWVEKAIGVGTQMFTYLDTHKGVLIAVGVIIGTVLVAAITAYIVKLAIAAVQSVINFAKMAASGTAWAVKGLIQMGELAAAWAVYVAKMLWSTGITVAQYAIQAAAATAAFIAENAAMLGIGIAIIALIAGIVWMATHWKQTWTAVKNVVTDAWHWIDSVLHNKITQIVLAFVAPILLVALHWRQLWSGAQTAISTAWSAIKKVINLFKTAGTDYITVQIDALKDTWNTAWSAVSTAVSDCWAIIQPIVQSIKDAVGDAAKAVGALGKAAGAVGGAAGKAGGFIKHVLADGGWTNAKGPELAIIHPNEYMLSASMLAGKQAIDPHVQAAVAGQIHQQGTASPGQAAVAFQGGGDTYYVTQVQGSIVDHQGLYAAVQKGAITQTRRNGAGGQNLTFSRTAGAT